MTGGEFAARWAPRAITDACKNAHSTYKRDLEQAYAGYFERCPELAGDHPRTARDLPSALPAGWDCLANLIPASQRHRHHLSGGSSQVLAVALLGSAAKVDPSLEWFGRVLELEARFESSVPRITFEYAVAAETLNERPRVTNVDVLIRDTAFLICAEAKLWEAGLGTCNCGGEEPDPDDQDDPATAPRAAQERGGCSSRIRERPLYYTAAEEVLGLPPREDGRNCPIAAPYQAVRNIAAARELAADRRPVFALFFDARNPYFAQTGEWPGWPEAMTTLAGHQEEVAVRTCSWQRLLRSGAVPPDVVEWAADKHGLV
jgi:hypothetical protein